HDAHYKGQFDHLVRVIGIFVCDLHTGRTVALDKFLSTVGRHRRRSSSSTMQYFDSHFVNLFSELRAPAAPGIPALSSRQVSRRNLCSEKSSPFLSASGSDLTVP